MEPSEGRRIAQACWISWWRPLPQNFKEGLGLECRPIGFGRLDVPDEIPSPEIWKGMATDAGERSGLIGFWVAWHNAGGFHGLELFGWDRATIYRKPKRFRTVFGAHPD